MRRKNMRGRERTPDRVGAKAVVKRVVEQGLRLLVERGIFQQCKRGAGEQLGVIAVSDDRLLVQDLPGDGFSGRFIRIIPGLDLLNRMPVQPLELVGRNRLADVAPPPRPQRAEFWSRPGSGRPGQGQGPRD
jgi:hypothetical protein